MSELKTEDGTASDLNTLVRLHVYTCGIYCGFYEFKTMREAIEDKKLRENSLGVLGCFYQIEA